MKTIYYLLVSSILLMHNAATAQSLKMMVANSAYKSMHYVDASELYKEILVKHPEDQSVILKLADCYFKMNDMLKAEQIYWKAYKNQGGNDTVVLQRLAYVLAENGKYPASEKINQKYLTLVNKGETKVMPVRNMSLFYKDSANIKLYDFKYNTRYSDFSPAHYKNGLVFCSSRIKSASEENTSGIDNSGYLDLYFADTTGTMDYNNYVASKKPEKQKMETPKPLESDIEEQIDDVKPSKSIQQYLGNNIAVSFSNRLNTKYHEGPCTFVGDTVIYFTRNSFYGLMTHKGQDHTTNLDIFVSYFRKGSWTRSELLSFCNKNYSEGHPAISSDGNTMYFVSNKPGGFGGTDLYQVQKENGKWMEPLNMGPEINSKYDELFPFISKDHILYFASGGHSGMGGLDIYRFNLDDYQPQVINMGFPINSKDDDFGLIMNNDGTNGFMSSNRKHRGTDDDIYFFTCIAEQDHKIQLLVTGADNVPLKNVIAEITEVSDDKVSESTILEGDSALIHILTGLQNKKPALHVITKSAGYLPDTLNIQPSEWLAKNNFTSTIVLKKQQVNCLGNVLDNKTGLPVHNAIVFFYNSKARAVDSILTDHNGHFSKMLDANIRYTVKAEKEHYFSQCTELTLSPENNVTQANELSLKMVKVDINTTVKIDDLSYDYNSSEIKPHAELILDNLLNAFLLTHPEIQIEIGSHTDSRGNDEYNKKLSQNRAEAVSSYIIKKGFPRAQIIAKGYGEAKPLNRCKNGIHCSEAEHSINRRTQIRVLGFLAKNGSAPNKAATSDEQLKIQQFNNCLDLSYVKSEE